MLLRSVIAGFLDNLGNERALDLPFLSLLADTGFYDVHFTHGPAEFGKDFIAKRAESGKVWQYAFQSKAGDIDQATFRGEVMPQLLEAITSGLGHPNFDTRASRVVILVASGRLKGNAPLAFQDFRRRYKRKNKRIEFWGREQLLDRFTASSPDAFYREDPEDLAAYGSFFRRYGDARTGRLLHEEIELHSRYWMRGQGGNRTRILFVGALEAELLAQACEEEHRRYEAIVCILSFVRALGVFLYGAPSGDKSTAIVSELLRSAMSRATSISSQYLRDLTTERSSADGDLSRSIEGASFVTYPIECSRAIEVSAIQFFVAEGVEKAAALSSLLDVVREDGCTHPISDKWSVSLVLAVLALVSGGYEREAQELVRCTAVWVADRYEHGLGLAEFDATALREVQVLIAAPFDRTSVRRRNNSFLATALCDLAAFCGDESLFLNVVNDFLATKVAFAYWQPTASAGQFMIDAADVVQYPNVEYSEKLTPFEQADFASHMREEVPSYGLATVWGPQLYVAAMVVLRDRYYPRVWPALVRTSVR